MFALSLLAAYTCAHKLLASQAAHGVDTHCQSVTSVTTSTHLLHLCGRAAGALDPINNSMQLPMLHLNTICCRKPEVDICEQGWGNRIDCGDVDKCFESGECDHVMEGTCKMGGQEHFYLEPHGSIVVPAENDEIKIIASTQVALGAAFQLSFAA